MRHLIPSLLSLTALSPLVSLVNGRYTLNIPPTLSSGPVPADFRTASQTQSDLDSPKLPRANVSTFDWWHFDAISLENPNASLAITFSNAGPNGFPLDLPGVSYVFPNTTNPGNETGEENTGTLYAHIAITFPDGRSVRHIQNVESARMHGSGDSSVAIWHGAGGWMGSEEGYEVEVVVNQTEVQMQGGMSFERITNPHTPCSLPTNFSSSLSLGDRGLGWVGVLPDAMARVDVTVNGERLLFEGYGYHDKVWSTTPFTSSVGTLHRGRAHLGLYSLLWVSYTPASTSTSPSDPSNPNPEQPQETIVSHFLARDGETISSGCSDTVSIVPGMEQTEGGLVSGFHVSIPGAEISVAGDNEVLDGNGEGAVAGHMRWHGRARGMLEGNDEEGVAFFERFEY
ncbi:hypothetical protein BDV06DRAFT_213447 [Aspergillus oleicola]